MRLITIYLTAGEALEMPEGELAVDREGTLRYSYFGIPGTEQVFLADEWQKIEKTEN